LRIPVLGVTVLAVVALVVVEMAEVMEAAGLLGRSFEVTHGLDVGYSKWMLLESITCK
jgi:hypothetical protein